MKAAILNGYDKNGCDLEIKDIPVPKIMSNEVLVKIKTAGGKYDKMASAKDQKYFFIFVHEDGAGLKKISGIFRDTRIEASVDEVFSLDEVNKAMKKVASGGSKGKTILKIS